MIFTSDIRLVLGNKERLEKWKNKTSFYLKWAGANDAYQTLEKATLDEFKERFSYYYYYKHNLFNKNDVWYLICDTALRTHFITGSLIEHAFAVSLGEKPGFDLKRKLEKRIGFEINEKYIVLANQRANNMNNSITNKEDINNA